MPLLNCIISRASSGPEPGLVKRHDRKTNLCPQEKNVSEKPKIGPPTSSEVSAAVKEGGRGDESVENEKTKSPAIQGAFMVKTLPRGEPGVMKGLLSPTQLAKQKEDALRMEIEKKEEALASNRSSPAESHRCVTHIGKRSGQH